MKKILITLFLFLLFPKVISAHSGRTDSSGCHNCYTGSCAGEYHCHNGGYSSGSSSSLYTPPKPRPLNPTNGQYETKVSSSNWCYYDVHFSWTGAYLTDGYSVNMSKTAGLDPGPKADTQNSYYDFINFASGKWYVNLKSINSSYGASADQVTYWEVTLPPLVPKLEAYIDGSSLNYSLSCLSKVEGPDFFIDYLETNRHLAQASIPIPSSFNSTSIVLKGWDKKGKEYSQTLTYNLPQPTSSVIVADSQTTNDDYDIYVGLFALTVLVGGYWFYKKIA
jgi:hypothetical protein